MGTANNGDVKCLTSDIRLLERDFTSRGYTHLISQFYRVKLDQTLNLKQTCQKRAQLDLIPMSQSRVSSH
jgi:hypothetical protein